MTNDPDSPDETGPIGLDETEAIAEPATVPEPPPVLDFDAPPPLYDITEADNDLARVEIAPEPATIPAIDPAPILDAIAAMGQTLGGRLDALSTRFDREIRAESTREKVVDRLHAELQEYKGDLLLNILRPLFVDLIQLHDDVGKMRPEEGVEESKIARVVADVQQAIEDILYRQGVEPFTLPESTFDPRRQRAVSTIPTDEIGLAKTVAGRLRKGFSAGEKVIRPEIVSVYVFKAT